MRSQRVPLAVALFVLVTAVSGQDTSEPRLINLNVIAVDSRGQPVDDLTADDFQITDAGKPQKIAFFRNKDSKLSEIPALAPNQVSNRRGPKFPYATVILFDLLNENFSSRGNARAELEHYLQSVESADYLYLYMLTVEGHLFPVHSLPEDLDDLAKPGEPPWTRQIKPIMDRVMKAVTRIRPLEIDIAARVQLTYIALNALGFQLAKLPGHKNIVWITNGVPIELGPHRSDTGNWVDFTAELRQLSEGLERAGVSIYPVQQAMIGDSNNTPASGTQTSTGSRPGDIIGGMATLDEFAGSTGGRPNNGKDIGGAIRQSMNDLRTGYQIAYYPSPPIWDGKYHKIHVTSPRKGVRIQARTGYYAWDQPADVETKQAIEPLFSASFDAAEIGLLATTSFDPAKPGVTRFEVRIDAQDIALATEGAQYKGELRIAAVARFTDGRSQISPIIPVGLQYTSADRDRVLKEGIFFAQNLTLSDDTASVRFIVYDRGSNTLGSITIPLKPK
jgi:VWFA-related protein